MSPGIKMTRKTLVRILPVAAALIAAILPALPAHASQSAAAKPNEGMQVPADRHVNALPFSGRAFAAPTASASPTAPPPHPVGVAHEPDAGKAGSQSTNTFCVSASTSTTSQCLNVRSCNFTAGVMQIWTIQITAGFLCDLPFYVRYVGNVNPQAVWPFTCGSGLNTTYAGDHVFRVTASDINSGFFYAPVSAGGGNPVNLGVLPGPNYTGPAGLWVQEDGNSSGSVSETRLIDAMTTCKDNNVPQHVYSGCTSNGCLIREGSSPPVYLAIWDWDTITGP